MKNYERHAVIYTAGCHGLVHVLELTYGAVLLDIAAEFGASLFVMGILANVFGLTFGIMGLPSGLLADRFNERRLLAVCGLGMALSSVIIGLSTGIYFLGAGLMALGISLGIYHPVSFAFITRVSSNSGMSFAYLGMGGNLGVAFGPMIASAVASSFNWRVSYLIFTIPAILLAIAFYFFSRVKITTLQNRVSQVNISEDSIRPLLVPLILVFVAAIMNGFIYRGIVTFLPAYLAERVSLSIFNMDSKLLAGAFTTIALSFGVGGQFLGGYLSGKIRRESLIFVISIIAVPMLILMGSGQGLFLVVASTIFAFFYFMGQPIYNVLLADYSPGTRRGRIYGLYFLCTFGLGSFSASILGYIAVKYGTNWVFMSSAGFGLITLICALLLLLKTLKHSTQESIGS
jgi:MFS family permease